MAILIRNNGTNNDVFTSKEILEKQSATIVFNGSGNTVQIGDGCILSGARMIFGDNCDFGASDNVRLSAIEVFAVKNGTVRIGERTGFTWLTALHLHEAGTIEIGSGCLFASGTSLSVSDVHKILDLTSGERINPPQDVIVGDQVWLADGVRLMKGSSVGSGSVIGAGSIVTGAIPPNSLAVGIPAKVIKSNIAWKY
jgi:acetyltransferase-like isoleucine patch superfamily enzyme